MFTDQESTNRCLIPGRNMVSVIDGSRCALVRDGDDLCYSEWSGPETFLRRRPITDVRMITLVGEVWFVEFKESKKLIDA